MDEIHAIKCPTLIVAPGAEPIGAVSLYDEMMKRIKDAELIIYEYARHNVYDYMKCAKRAGQEAAEGLDRIAEPQMLNNIVYLYSITYGSIVN